MNDMRARGLRIRAARQTHDPDVANWIASTKTRGAKTESLNVRLWLTTVLTAPDKQCPLYPRQPTSQPARPLSHRFRLLPGDERAYGGVVCRVRV